MNEKTLPGAPVSYRNAASTGYSTNSYGGEIPADDEIGDFFERWKKEQNY